VGRQQLARAKRAHDHWLKHDIRGSPYLRLALLFALWAAGHWVVTGEWNAITLGRFLHDTFSMGDIERGFLGLPAFVALLILGPVFLFAAVIGDRTGGWLGRRELDRKEFQ
jgi:hypothetical protein